MDSSVEVLQPGTPLGTPKCGRTALPVCSTPIGGHGDDDGSCTDEEDDILTFLHTLDEFINSCSTSLSGSADSLPRCEDDDGATLKANCKEVDITRFERQLFPQTQKNEKIRKANAVVSRGTQSTDCDLPGTSIPGRRSTVDVGTSVLDLEHEGHKTITPSTSMLPPGYEDVKHVTDDAHSLIQEAVGDGCLQTVRGVTSALERNDENTADNDANKLVLASGCRETRKAINDGVTGQNAASRNVAQSLAITSSPAGKAVGLEVQSDSDVEVTALCIDTSNDADYTVVDALDADASVEDDCEAEDTVINSDCGKTAAAWAADAEIAGAGGTTNADSKVDSIEAGDGGKNDSEETVTQEACNVTLMNINTADCDTPGAADFAACSDEVADFKNRPTRLFGIEAAVLDATCIHSAGLNAVDEKVTGSVIVKASEWDVKLYSTLSEVLLRGVLTCPDNACSKVAGEGPERIGGTKNYGKSDAYSVGTELGRAWMSSKDMTLPPTHAEWSRKDSYPPVPSATTHEPAITNAKSNVASPNTCSKPAYFTEIWRSFQETPTAGNVEKYHVDWVRDNKVVAIIPTPGPPRGGCREGEMRETPATGSPKGYHTDSVQENSMVANIPTPGSQKLEEGGRARSTYGREEMRDLLLKRNMMRYCTDWSQGSSTLAGFPTPGLPGVDETEWSRVKGKYKIDKSASFSLEKWLDCDEKSITRPHSVGKDDRATCPSPQATGDDGMLAVSSPRPASQKSGDVLLIDLEKDDVLFVDEILEDDNDRQADGVQMQESLPTMIVQAQSKDVATTDLRHKLNSLRSSLPTVIGAPRAPDVSVNGTEIKSEVPGIRKRTPVKAAHHSISPAPSRLLPSAETLLPVKLEFPSEEVPPEPVATRGPATRAPFFSEDPEENDDNANPAWENIRQLSTDEERYEAVRSVWHNETVPDPNCNLSRYRHRARQLGMSTPKVRKPTLGKGHKRKASGSVYNNPAKRRRMDTDIFDLKLKELERKTNDDYNAAQHTLELNLQRVREQVNSQMVNYGYGGHRRCATAPWDMRYWQQHQEELLHYKFMTDTQNIRNKYSARASKLLDARHEVRHFNKFYVGLSGSDPTMLTEWQMGEQLKIEKILGHFKMCYRVAWG